MPRSAAASPHSLLAELDGGIRSGKCYVNRCQRFPFGWLADRSCASSSAATCSVLARARVALACGLRSGTTAVLLELLVEVSAFSDNGRRGIGAGRRTGAEPRKQSVAVGRICSRNGAHGNLLPAQTTAAEEFDRSVSKRRTPFPHHVM